LVFGESDIVEDKNSQVFSYYNNLNFQGQDTFWVTGTASEQSQRKAAETSTLRAKNLNNFILIEKLTASLLKKHRL